MQQHGLALRELPADGGERLALDRGRLGRRERAPGGADVVAGQLDEPDMPLAGERAEDRAVGMQQPAGDRPVRHAALRTRGGDLEQRLVLFRRAARESFEQLVERPFVAQPVGQEGERLGAGAELLFGEGLFRVARGLHQGGQRGAHHLAERAHVVVGRPLPEAHLRGREQRPVVEPAVVDAPHQPGVDLVRPELHGDGRAGHDVQPFVHGEGVDRLGQREYDVGENHGV